MVMASIQLAACSRRTTHNDGNAKNEWYEYEPAKATLVGILRAEEKYGPPKYRETPEQDQKTKIYVLYLEKAINVRVNVESDEFSPIEGAREIQILKYKFKGNLEEYREKMIKVTGMLTQAMTGHHYTKALISLEEIVEVKE